MIQVFNTNNSTVLTFYLYMFMNECIFTSSAVLMVRVYSDWVSFLDSHAFSWNCRICSTVWFYPDFYERTCTFLYFAMQNYRWLSSKISNWRVDPPENKIKTIKTINLTNTAIMSSTSHYGVTNHALDGGHGYANRKKNTALM